MLRLRSWASSMMELGEQDAVGHHLDPGLRTGPVGEPHLVAHLVTQRRRRLLGEPLGHRTGRDAPRLGVPDQPAPPPSPSLAATELQADLGQLGGLPGPGLTGDDDGLVVTDGRRDLVVPLADRQLGREGDVHNAGDSPPAPAQAPTELPGVASGSRCVIGSIRPLGRPNTQRFLRNAPGSPPPGQVSVRQPTRPTQGPHRIPTDPGTTVRDMTHINRSRRLQAGLAGLSVVSALGAAVGLGLTTHTGSSQTSQGTAADTGTSQQTSRSDEGGGESDDSTSSRQSTSTNQSQSSQQSQSSPVSKPANTTPQATTSGS
jgi:hypothetical protein